MGRPKSTLRMTESLPLIREHIAAVKAAGGGLRELLRIRAATLLIAATRSDERSRVLRAVVRSFELPEHNVREIIRAIDRDARKRKRPAKARKRTTRVPVVVATPRRRPCRYGSGAYVTANPP